MTPTTPSTAPLPEWKDFIRLEIDGLTFYGEDCDHARLTAGAYTKLRSALLSAQSAPDVAKAVAFYEAGKKALETVDRMFSEPGKLNERTVAKMVRDTLAITKDNPNG